MSRLEKTRMSPRAQRELAAIDAALSAETVAAEQKPLAERWQLVVVNRPGFAPNPPEPRCDFEADAEAIAALLDEPAHLVGHSYGGLIALLAASYCRLPE